MGCTWGNPTPPASGPRRPDPTRVIRDGGRPLTFAETVIVSVLVAAVLGLGVWAAWAAGHRVQGHLERLCNAGSAYACAASDGHP